MSDQFGCSPTCIPFKGFDCNKTISINGYLRSECKEICGDNFIVANETCDDGADKDDEGCLDGCKSGPNPFWNCTHTMDQSVCVPICDDGFQVGTEVCDSGGKEGCDSCKSVKDGWTCKRDEKTKASECFP